MPRKSLRVRVEERAQERREYCHAPQRVCGYRFHLEHIVPLALGGSNADSNRALACASCNLAKSDRVSGTDLSTGADTPLFHPRAHLWQDHFAWADDQSQLTGRTGTGRATVTTLDMNSELRQAARQLWFAMGLLP